MENSNGYNNTISMLGISLLPLIIIGLSIVGWLIVGSVWVVTLIINVFTIVIGSFVIIPIEWLFLLADWILLSLGPFIAGYFTQAHFFNWLNNLYLVIGFSILGFVMDKLGLDIFDSKTLSDVTSSIKTSKNSANSSTRRNSTQSHLQSSLRSSNGSRGSHARSAGQSTSQPMSLLGALQGGMQLEAYLPQDVIKGIEDILEIAFDPIYQSKFKNGGIRYDKLNQLMMEFDTYRNTWNRVKTDELRLVTEKTVQRHQSGSNEPIVIDNPEVRMVHRAMLNNIEKILCLYKGIDVDLEHPLLAWVELDPIIKKITQGQISTIALQDDMKDQFLSLLYGGEFPLRYHNTMKDIHSDTIDDVLSPEYRIDGIPLPIARIEFVDYGIWFLLQTVGGLKYEFQDKPTMVCDRPQAIIFKSVVRIGVKPNQLTQKDIDQFVSLLMNFLQNPVAQNIRIHFPIELAENYLKEQMDQVTYS